MFQKFRKDPLKLAQKRYSDILKKAMAAQRAGNIQEYARLTALANEASSAIAKLESSRR